MEKESNFIINTDGSTICSCIKNEKPTIKELKDSVINDLVNKELYIDDYKIRVELLKVILENEK